MNTKTHKNLVHSKAQSKYMGKEKGQTTLARHNVSPLRKAVNKSYRDSVKSRI